MLVHRKQYAVGPEPWLARPDWQTASIGPLVVSYCPTLTIKISGRRCVIGDVVDIDAPNRAPALGTARPKDTWAGRWLLLGENVWLDSAGLLGCYFAKTQNGLWLSSSLAILASICGTKGRAQRLPAGIGLDWNPPPVTPFPQIRKLLPSQLLSLPEGTVSARKLVVENTLPYNVLLDCLQEALVSTVKAFTAQGHAYLTLTGGFDSRLVLATCVYAGIHPDCVTWWSESRTDTELPPLLASAAECSHEFIYPQPRNKDVLRLYKAHTGNQCLGMGNRFATGSLLVPNTNTDTILRGGCFELGRQFYRRFPCTCPDAHTIVRCLHHPRPRQHIVEGLQQWISWIKEHPENLDWRDRFYWEQRLGGWLSDGEQAHDLLPGKWLHVANSRKVLSLLLAVPPEKRANSQHHLDLIGRMAPQLLRYPFVLPERLTKRLAMQGTKATAYLRALLGEQEP